MVKKRMEEVMEDTKDVREIVAEVEQGGIRVPLKIETDGKKARRQDLPARIHYGAHKSARTFGVHVDMKVLGDMLKGWAFPVPQEDWEKFQNLCVSPLGAVHQKDKVRVVHDLSISFNGDVSLNEMVDKERLASCMRYRRSL